MQTPSWAFTFNNPMYSKDQISALVDKLIETVLEKLKEDSISKQPRVRSLSCPCFGQNSRDIDNLSPIGKNESN